jgi:molybdate transport system permease protein
MIKEFLAILTSQDFISTLLLTFKLATFTTIILLFIGLPLSYFLVYKRIPLKTLIETVITLPIVLPPTVLGFYYIILFSTDNPIGSFFEKYLNLQLIFSFEGIVFASVIYSLPFMVQPLQNGLKSIPFEIIEASYTLGKSELETILKVILPNMKNAILTAIILTFAHTIGEFGLVLMVGGAIPNETLVASIAIYNELQNLNYPTAHAYAFVLLTISFLTIFLINFVNKKLEKEININR